jgi:uncharacterized membrane protein YgdD (TMEM256/DUF423 family)
MIWSALGAAALAVAVAAGAFGAHGLRGRLDDYSMGIYERAVFYQFIHALGLLLVPLFLRLDLLSNAAATRVCALLLAGIVLFSGSLYILAFSGIRLLGAVTPFGGLAFIIAWALLAFELSRRSRV